jgi:hypothetical protein
MGLPYSGPISTSGSCCDSTYSGRPDIAPFVVSIEGLYGIVDFVGNGAISISTLGNSIIFGVTAEAGLGSVTSVGLTSTAFTVTGSPITTNGSFTIEPSGALLSLQNLVTAADKLPYTTASNTYATTDFSAYARTLLDDTTASAARTTLGVAIGLNVQAWSADLDEFVTNASWTGGTVTFAGGVTVSGNLIVSGTTTFGNSVDLNSQNVVNGSDADFGGTVSAVGFSGDGSALTALSATQLTTGTTAVARGGTGLASYAVGDLIYASGATTLAKLADVAAGAFLRSGGVGTAPAWSSITLPNSLAIGDLLYASTTGIVSRLADVATGNALISGGVGVAPSWGKITTSHTTGIAASGVNADITSLNSLSTVGSDVTFELSVSLNSTLLDSNADAGSGGEVLTSNGSGTVWSNQLTLSTLYLSGYLALNSTITSIGTTGAVTINKPAGSANLAAAATSLVVTNSLCISTSIIIATVASNDSTCKSVQVVPATGSFTIYPDAAPTATTSVRWVLINPS